MKRLLLAICSIAILLATTCLANSYRVCPPETPARERTRIVRCTDNTRMVQAFTVYSKPNYWFALTECGLSIPESRKEKARSIQFDILRDAVDCPAPPVRPLDPLEIVE